MIKNKIVLAAAFVLAAGHMTLPAYANSSEPLQAIFSSSGDRIKIVVSEPVAADAKLLIANETLSADLVTDQVNVRTTVLIDNSGSVPKAKRNEVLDAVRHYVEQMPENEMLRVAKFDTETEMLADDYSTDSKYIEYQLEKIDFKGQETYVYDALMSTVNAVDPNSDAYYRTVLITDGADTVGGTSFDLLRTEINEQGRYHIDVVEVGNDDKQDVNLKAIGSLGSNTYKQFENVDSLNDLSPAALWMVCAPLTNSVTTGELKGVTIKSGDTSIPLGSLLIPQAELAEPEPETVPTTATTKVTTVTTTAPAPVKKSKPLPLALFIGLGALAVGAIVALIFLMRKMSKVCEVCVHIDKEDLTGDTNGVGDHKWIFPINGSYRVGRVLEPMNGANEQLPTNQFAICEMNDVGSIGRNAFMLAYDKNRKQLAIQNVASNAIFAVENSEGVMENLQCGQSRILEARDKILLGNYTNVKIKSITVRCRKSGDKNGK